MRLCRTCVEFIVWPTSQLITKVPRENTNLLNKFSIFSLKFPLGQAKGTGIHKMLSKMGNATSNK